MPIFFPRPDTIPKVPDPVVSDSSLTDVTDISPEFLRSLPTSLGGTKFSSRKRLHLLVVNPSEVHEVLVVNSNDYLKGEQEIALSKAIGWGLIGLEGSVHKHAHKTARPALQVNALDSYVSTIKKVAGSHIEALGTETMTPMRRALRCLSQEAAERSLFSSTKAEVDYSYQDYALDLNAALFSPDVTTSTPKTALQLTRSYSKSRQRVIDHVSKLIQEWKTDPSTGTFLIDYLSSGHEISEENFGEFHQQVSVFLQAATETTAALTSWTLLLLADNPTYWRNLQREVREAGSLDTYDSIMNLRLLDAVISESLRLYPPAWLIPRIARVDTSVGGKSVKAGTRVVVSPYVSHRLSEFFEEPESFKPERWLTAVAALPRGLFFPFGMGNRICIGERYGKLAAKIIIVSALERGGILKSDHSRVQLDGHSLLLNPDPTIKFGLGELS